MSSVDEPAATADEKLTAAVDRVNKILDGFGGDVDEAVQRLQHDAFRQDCAVAAELHGLAALDPGLRKVYVVGDSGSGHTVERDLKACYRISKHKIRVN